MGLTASRAGLHGSVDQGTIPDDLRESLYRIGRSPRHRQASAGTSSATGWSPGSRSAHRVCFTTSRYVRTRAFRRTNETGKWPPGSPPRTRRPPRERDALSEHGQHQRPGARRCAVRTVGGAVSRTGSTLTLDTEGPILRQRPQTSGAFSASQRPTPPPARCSTRCRLLASDDSLLPARPGRTSAASPRFDNEVGFRPRLRAHGQHHWSSSSARWWVRKPVSVALGLGRSMKLFRTYRRAGNHNRSRTRGGPGTRMETDALFLSRNQRLQARCEHGG